MRNKFWFLTKISFLKKIKNKTFIIVNILLFIILVSLTNIDSIINFFGGDFKKDNNIMLVDYTNNFYDIFDEKMSNNPINTFNYKLTRYYDEESARKKIKSDNDILLIVKDDIQNTISVKLVTYGYINSTLYGTLESISNDIKKELSLKSLNLDKTKLNSVTNNIELTREFINGKKNEKEEKNNLLLTLFFPILILPFFLLTVTVIQMIGAEINEEKSTRSMEIIISNVSAKTHFFSKVLATNVFVFVQTVLLFVYSSIGLLLRPTNLDINTLSSSLNGVDLNLDFSMFSKMLSAVPGAVVLMIVTIFAYSLLAGILASVTTNMEDFQQMQMPIVIIMLISFYLSLASAMFNGSLFIRILSYIPFVSSILSPCLYLTGVLGIKDVIISIVLMIFVVFILIKYGLKIYKNGILNYSSNKLWRKIFKSIKE